MENKSKKISFIVAVPFQWYVHKNVYKQFGERAEVIIDMGTHGTRWNENDLNTIISLLERHGAKYRVLNFDDYNNSEYLENFFKDVECLVSLWENGCMRIKETKNIKKVNLPYGVGKELTITRKSKGIFDLVLAYGPRDAKLFSLTTTTIAIGIPKFDDYFNNIVDEKLFKEIEQKIDKNKKTILYLPTHSDLSSLDILKGEIKKLDDEYNVIVKLHYYNSREDPSILTYFDDSKVILFNDDADLITLFKFADLVLSDNSSVIFDAILVDIPTVVADFWDEEFLDKTHKLIKIFKRGRAAALTFPDSIEQLIKREGRIAVLKDKNDLRKVIIENLVDDRYGEERKKLCTELFAFMDGDCAKRAKEEIEKLLDGRTVSRKGILYHTFINHENTNSLMFPDNQRLVDENNFLRNFFEHKKEIKKYKINIVLLDPFKEPINKNITLESIKYLSKFNTSMIDADNLSIIDFRETLLKEQEDSFIHFVQAGTVLNSDLLEKHLAILLQYENVGVCQSKINLSNRENSQTDNYFFSSFIFPNPQNNYFQISPKLEQFGFLNGVTFKANFYNEIYSGYDLNPKRLIFLRQGVRLGFWRQAFLNESFLTNRYYSQKELMYLFYLKAFTSFKRKVYWLSMKEKSRWLKYKLLCMIGLLQAKLKEKIRQ